MIEGDAVIHELVLPVATEQAFDMFTDPQRLVRWIGISADLEARPGGRFRFEVVPGQFCEGRYLVVERPGRLVFTWGWTDPAFGLPPGSSRVEVTLTPEGASVQWETEPPLRTGSRVAFTARFLGGQLAYSYEITEFVPAERLVMRTAQGPFPMQTTYTWQAVGDGSTRMTLRNRGEPAGFSALAAPFMATAIRRANRKDLRKLRSILETG